MLKIIYCYGNLRIGTWPVTLASQPAFARDGGAIAAGVVGGLAVGAIVGSQMNRDDGYRDDGYR